jgi:GDPmannose 4,6-dehydratase
MRQKKVALITGITGQDGALLAKFLLDKGYEVYGTFRRASSPNFWRLQALGIETKVNLIPADVTDMASILEAIKFARPDEVYHLAAQSFVGASFETPVATSMITGIGTVNVLEAVRQTDPSIKVYFAATSELYGNTRFQGKINEETPFNPASPYAVAKLFGYYMTKVYREGYKMFAVSGILFNHESEYRGLEFVTRKISNGVAKIYLGLSNELKLGNLDAKRDWGYAPEYVEAMWLMLQQDKPEDFVIATGEAHSVREFVEEAFSYVGLDWTKYVKVDKAFMRPVDVNVLVGDYSKAKQKLGWEPRTPFKELVRKMVRADIERWQRWLNGEKVPFDAPYYDETAMRIMTVGKRRSAEEGKGQ